MANPWEDAPVVGSSANPWESAPVVTPSKAKPEKSMLRKIADVHPGVAAAETALSLATGTLAQPVAGLAGIGASIGRGLGLTKADPADVVRNIQGMAYQPRTEGAQQALSAISAPFEWLGKGADIAGSATAEATGSPLLGAAVNTGIQALPEIVGKGLKKSAARRLARETEALEVQRKANLPRDTQLAEARAANYVFPPSVTGQKGPLNSFFQGTAGSTALDYGASFKNQKQTNRIVKQELGLPLDEAITRESLDSYRNKQGAAYEQVKSTLPELKVTENFRNTIRNVDSNFAQARAEFPEYFKNSQIEKLVKDLDKEKFSSKAAIELQKKLRYDGYSNLKAFDKPDSIALGEAQINAARAIDSLIDENLALQAPKGVKNFQSKLASNLQEARKRIAQSYAVEKALNDSGNVSAQTLAKIWDKDQSLTGGLQTVAKTAKQFKQQMRDVDKLPATASERISNLDVAKATGLAALGHGALGAGATAARAVAKPLLLSDFYQALGTGPSYTPGLSYTAPAAVFGSPLYPVAAIPRPPYVPPQE